MLSRISERYPSWIWREVWGLIGESEYGGYRAKNFAVLMFAELATNCILNKEYDKKQYIGIYVYSDHISFINHNRPLPPVTIEDMNCEDEFRDRNYLNPEIKEMFFALDLIESYGSGIRRAKNAMKANGSPELVFEPDNDIDDYTMVTAYINEEFKKIQQEEQGLGSAKVSDKTSKMRDKMSHKQLLVYSCAERFIEIQGYVTTMDISKEKDYLS